MKKYHECAVVRNGNNIEGYFVFKSDGNLKRELQKLSKQWYLMNKEQFTELVINENVQYLVYDNKNIVCRYTNEEERQVIKLGTTKEFMRESEMHYFDMDLSFKLKHIIAASKAFGLAAGTGTVAKILGFDMLMIYLYGTKRSMLDVLDEISKLTCNKGIIKSFVHDGNNIGRVTIPLMYIDTLIHVSVKYNIMYDTTALEYINSIDNIEKTSMIFKKASNWDVQSYINVLKDTTLGIEKRFGI